MKISAPIKNKLNQNEITVQTNEEAKNLRVPSKSPGFGSSVNGGELLLLSPATCFCNDIYCEADKRNITVKERIEYNFE